VIEPIEAVAKAHAVRDGQTQRGKRKSHPVLPRRDRDGRQPLDGTAICQDLFDLHQCRRKAGRDATRVRHRKPTAGRQPDASMRIDRQDAMSLDRLGVAEAVRCTELAHVAAGEGALQEPFTIDPEHTIARGNPQTASAVLG
jgi:hypothetical protein